MYKKKMNEGKRSFGKTIMSQEQRVTRAVMRLKEYNLRDQIQCRILKICFLLFISLVCYFKKIFFMILIGILI